MSPSPTCIVNNTSTLNGVDVSLGSTVLIELLDLTGVSSWSISVVGTDDEQSAATINAGISIDVVNKTCSFTAPASARGAAMIFESKVNQGVDLNGQRQPSYTTRFGVFAIGVSGLRLIALNQKTEGNSEFGWISDINYLLAEDGTGNATSIAGSEISGTPTSGDLLVYNGTNWVPTDDLVIDTLEVGGTVEAGATTLGLYGVTPVTRPVLTTSDMTVITGSSALDEVKTALSDLIQKLDAVGVIDDSNVTHS